MMENERVVGRRGGRTTSMATKSNFGEGGKCDGRGLKSTAVNINVGMGANGVGGGGSLRLWTLTSKR